MSKLESIIIPIDGTTGSGKNHLGMKFAERKGFQFIDSGWVFRLITFAALEEKIDLESEEDCAELFKSLNISCDSKRIDNTSEYIIRLGGLNITRFLSERRIDNNVSQIARHSKIRELVKEQYLKFVDSGSVVIVGRDIGTAIFPDAQVKFYINADLDLRAERRLKQRALDSKLLTQIKSEISQRDFADSSRKIAPLKKAEDAFEIINDGRAEEALELMLEKYDEVMRK